MDGRLPGIAILLVFPAALLGYGYPASYGTGSSLMGLDPVTVSVGGVTSLDLGGSVVMLNPSGLALLPGPRIQAGVGPVLSKETIETPFGRFNVSTIAMGSVGMTAAAPVSPGIGAGLGISRLSDFSYKGEYLLISPGSSGMMPDTVKVFEQQDNSGGFWEAAGGVGAKLTDRLYIGASAGYRFGSATVDYYYDNIHNSPDLPPDTSYVETWEESGFAYRAGLTAVLSRARLGATYTSGMERYPARASFGAGIGNMAVWESALGADVELLFPGDSTRFTARLFGGTPLYGSNLYGRASVFLFNSQGSNTREGTGLSMGMSVRIAQRMTLDAAFSTITENRTGDVFGGYWEQASVTDSHSALAVGFTWNP